MSPIIHVDGWRCLRGGHTWPARPLGVRRHRPEPRTCSRCKSPYWTRRRKSAKLTQP